MRKITILTALVCLSVMAWAQPADEEAIKKVIQANSDAILRRDIDAWKATVAHDSKAFTTFVSRYGYNETKSWDSMAAAVERDWKANPKSNFAQVKMDNYTIRSNGNMAFVDYDVTMTPADAQPDIFPYTREARLHDYETLVKEADGWKILSRIRTQPETYTNNGNHDIETDINATGYRLLAANKINEAIEIFKLNVKLYPNSFNTYDSLGEAYALAGNKKSAIENYEKSMKLNPKNDNGTAALAKLKQK